VLLSGCEAGAQLTDEMAILMMAAPLPMLRLVPFAAAVRTRPEAVLAEGQVRIGFYEQKVQQKSGKIVYICRSTSDGKFRKQADYDSAGAQRP